MGQEAELPGVENRSAPPLALLRPPLALAGFYALAALAWAAFGRALPGGRWLAVHLFTLGVLSNLVAALTLHFAVTLLHARPRTTAAGRLVLLNVGALAVLAGLPAGQRWVVALGGCMVTGAVCWLYVTLRRIRREALPGRFTFVVRVYERAAGAFVHGALLGVLMGTGLLGGAWYGAARLAHLHINVLGWGGLTLLATAVFFAPTVMRARIEQGADEAAARALPRAAAGLTVGVLALLATGAGGGVALAARLLAAAGLAVYALGVAAVCLPVLRTGRRAHPSAEARMLQAAAAWFLLAAIADVVVVASGRLGPLAGLGTVMLVGVLGQAILGASGHLVPLATGSGGDARATARRRLARLSHLRPLVLNLGVALVAAGAVAGRAGDAGAWSARAGWGLIIVAVLAQLLMAIAAATPPPSGGVGWGRPHRRGRGGSRRP